MAVEHGCEPGKTLVEHGNENESGGFHGQPRFFMVDHGGSERDGLDGSVWHTGIPSFIIGLRFQPRFFFFFFRGERFLHQPTVVEGHLCYKPNTAKANKQVKLYVGKALIPYGFHVLYPH